MSVTGSAIISIAFSMLLIMVTMITFPLTIQLPPGPSYSEAQLNPMHLIPPSEQQSPTLRSDTRKRATKLFIWAGGLLTILLSYRISEEHVFRAFPFEGLGHNTAYPL